MWKYVTSDGEEVLGNREEIGEYLNVHDLDVYDDDIWEQLVALYCLKEVPDVDA